MELAKYKKKSFEEKKKEVEKITEQMDEQIQSYYETPEQMKEYLSFMSKFHNYSTGNIGLIQSQFKGAQAVGSFKFWKEKGYSVQKGEKGIKILAPNKTIPKFKNGEGNWQNLKYATVKEKEQIKDGLLDKREGRLYFSLGTVFDISQTNARTEDLPEIFPNRWLEGNVENFKTLDRSMRKIAEKNNVHIVMPEWELGAAKGASYTASRLDIINDDLVIRKEVTLNPRNSELQNVKTLIHELAHARLHTPETENNYSSEEKEFQAEMVAFAVSDYFGIDTSEYSLKYLANWTKDKELTDKKQLLKEVNETAADFITTMENELIIEKEMDKNIILLDYKSKDRTEEIVSVQELRNRLNLENGSRNDLIEAYDSVKTKNQTAIDTKRLDGPHLIIVSSEITDLKANSLISFGDANALLEKYENTYSDAMGYYKVNYDILFPKTEVNSKLEIIEMKRLDVGDGMFLNPHHHIRKEGNLSDEHWQQIDSSYQDYLLKDEKKETTQWVDKNRTKVAKEME